MAYPHKQMHRLRSKYVNTKQLQRTKDNLTSKFKKNNASELNKIITNERGGWKQRLLFKQAIIKP